MFRPQTPGTPGQVTPTMYTNMIPTMQVSPRPDLTTKAQFHEMSWVYFSLSFGKDPAVVCIYRLAYSPRLYW